MGQGGTADLGSGLDGFLNDLARRIAHFLGEQTRGEGPREGLVDQHDSPLGNRGHCAAVRRRLAAGEAGADISGRRHFLTREALAEELKRSTSRKLGRARDGEPDPVAELERALSRLGRRDI
jgi:hypothetical protein